MPRIWNSSVTCYLWLSMWYLLSESFYLLFFLGNWHCLEMVFLCSPTRVSGFHSCLIPFGKAGQTMQSGPTEPLEKSEFSPKLLSCITFCRPGVIDDHTNQFLKRAWLCHKIYSCVLKFLAKYLKSECHILTNIILNVDFTFNISYEHLWPVMTCFDQ